MNGDIDTADLVYDFFKSIIVQSDIVIGNYAERIADRALGEIRTSIGVRGIDLMKAMFGDVDGGIARYAQDIDRLIVEIYMRDHDGIASSPRILQLDGPGVRIIYVATQDQHVDGVCVRELFFGVKTCQ